MSKKTTNTEKQTAWNHVVVEESGGRGTYFDMPDDKTKYGTGHAEVILRALGFNDLDNKKHWLKDNRPHGSRRDIGIAVSNIARMKVTMNSEHTEGQYPRKVVALNKQWFDTVFAPEVHKLQALRGNPKVRQRRNTIEMLTNQISHLEGNEEELHKAVMKESGGLIDGAPKELKESMLEYLTGQYIETRKAKLEELKKKK